MDGGEKRFICACNDEMVFRKRRTVMELINSVVEDSAAVL